MEIDFFLFLIITTSSYLPGLFSLFVCLFVFALAKFYHTFQYNGNAKKNIALFFSCLRFSCCRHMMVYSVKPWSQDWLIAAGAYQGFCSMKRLGVFLLPLDGMLVHRRSLPPNFLGFPNNLPLPNYTSGWREAL